MLRDKDLKQTSLAETVAGMTENTASSLINTYSASQSSTNSTSKQMSPTSSDQTQGAEGVRFKNWYVKYKNDKDRRSRITGISSQKPRKSVAVNDMSQWFILRYLPDPQPTTGLPETSKTNSPSTRRSSLVERLLQTRKKEMEPSKPDLVLPWETFELSKQEIRRQEVIYELISTERDYVNDMKVLSELFVKKIREKKLIPAAGIKKIFSNVEEIQGVNELLYKKLFERRASCFETALTASQGKFDDGRKPGTVLESMEIGDILMLLTPYLRSYALYCSNHSDASEYLESRLSSASRLNSDRLARTASRLNKRSGKSELKRSKSVVEREQEEELVLFLQYCSFRPECKNMDLFSFLIKPIQRICKYPLLIRELLRCTSKQHPDYEQLNRSLVLIEQVVKEINERTRFMEGHQTRMVELRKQLSFDNAMFIGFTEDVKKDDGKVSFDILGEASRKLVSEVSSSLIQIHELSRGAKHAEFKDCSPRWLILCSDIIIMARPPEKRLFSSETQKAQVKTVIKGLDVISVAAGLQKQPDVDAITLAKKRKLGYVWHMVVDIDGKLPSEETKHNTIKRRRSSLPNSRVVLNFCSASAAERDILVETIHATITDAKAAYNDRQKILKNRESKASISSNHSDRSIKSVIDLQAEFDAIDLKFEQQLKPKSPIVQSLTSLNSRSAFDVKSTAFISAPALNKIPNTQSSQDQLEVRRGSRVSFSAIEHRNSLALSTARSESKAKDDLLNFHFFSDLEKDERSGASESSSDMFEHEDDLPTESDEEPHIVGSPARNVRVSNTSLDISKISEVPAVYIKDMETDSVSNYSSSPLSRNKLANDKASTTAIKDSYSTREISDGASHIAVFSNDDAASTSFSIPSSPLVTQRTRQDTSAYNSQESIHDFDKDSNELSPGSKRKAELKSISFVEPSTKSSRSTSVNSMSHASTKPVYNISHESIVDMDKDNSQLSPRSKRKSELKSISFVEPSVKSSRSISMNSMSHTSTKPVYYNSLSRTSVNTSASKKALFPKSSSKNSFETNVSTHAMFDTTESKGSIPSPLNSRSPSAYGDIQVTSTRGSTSALYDMNIQESTKSSVERVNVSGLASIAASIPSMLNESGTQAPIVLRDESVRGSNFVLDGQISKDDLVGSSGESVARKVSSITAKFESLTRVSSTSLNEIQAKKREPVVIRGKVKKTAMIFQQLQKEEDQLVRKVSVKK